MEREKRLAPQFALFFRRMLPAGDAATGAAHGKWYDRPVPAGFCRFVKSNPGNAVPSKRNFKGAGYRYFFN